jgi:hypothetical protein
MRIMSQRLPSPASHSFIMEKDNALGPHGKVGLAGQPPMQPELPRGLPPMPPRCTRSSAHARRVEGLASFCGRSPSWGRTAELRLAAAGITGHEIIVFALVGAAFLRLQAQQERGQQLAQAFNRLIQLFA